MRVYELSRLSRLLTRYRTWLNAIFQAMLIVCSMVMAWMLRFDFGLPYRQLLFASAPVLVFFRMAAIAYFGLLHGWWRYTGINDAVDISKAVATGSAGFFIFMHYVLGVTNFPRSIYVLEALLTAGLLVGVRLFSRVLAESARQDQASWKKVMLIGAGFASQIIIREIKQPGSGYAAVGCVDDDRSKWGIKIHGVPVLGNVDQLPDVVFRYQADEVLIAVPSATGKEMQRFVEICQQAEVKFRTVPALRDLISGQVIVNQIREVNLEDLLGRDPVEIDLESVRQQLENQVVLVTGAAGSIGSELCRQILEYAPTRLLCLDQSETGIFYLQLELSKHQNRAQLVFCVADVGDRASMQSLFLEHKPQVVFHAAAYKHVPVMESNVHEAVKNNVFALLSLLEVAEESGCRSFVLISSDKAVNPTSVMGATKRMGELILSCRPANSMRCVTVRFGNILGSSGSVVRVLQEQLRNSQPLTITHPEIKRFFMTTREAVALVLQAFAIDNHGDILVLEMGKPVRILDLARSLIRLSGKSDDQVRIRFTGLRQGEKLIEELFYPTEEIHPTSCEKIKRTRAGLCSWTELQNHLEELRASLALNGAGPIRAKIKEIVPEYSYVSDLLTEESATTQAPEALEQAAGRS